jgi:hypothetical protein
VDDFHSHKRPNSALGGKGQALGGQKINTLAHFVTHAGLFSGQRSFATCETPVPNANSIIETHIF